MPNFFLNKKLIIILAGIILLLALVGFSIKNREKLTWAEEFIKDAVSVIEEMVAKPTQYMVGIVENVRDISNTYDENQMLKERLEDYASLEANIYELEKENKELRQTIDKKNDLMDYKTIHSTVITRNPDQWNDVITIDKGEHDGVQKNMAVITHDGLIGKIKSVSKFNSTVQLITALDRTNRISAIVQGKSKVFGLIEGFDQETQQLVFKNIPSNAKIKAGQTVITSGLGGIFPKGLVIGKVKEVVNDQYGLTKTAYLKPSADLYDINNVLIVERTASVSTSDIEEGE